MMLRGSKMNNLQNFISKERLNKYLLISSNNINIAMELYKINLEISNSLYIPLSYFEIFLRNFCNDKLKKELGEYWFESNILYGNNIKKGQWAIDEITKVKNKIKKSKKDKEIMLTNGDIISNLELSFWSNLFCSNYENHIWSPYLKQIFIGFERKKLFKDIDGIRKLRNRIFHYEPIIFDEFLEDKYKNIIALISFISNQDISDFIENESNFCEIYIKLKNSGAPLN